VISFRKWAKLPLLAKIGVGLVIPVIFVVVTQWEHLTFKEPPILTPPKGAVLVPTPEVHFNNFQIPPSEDKTAEPVAEAMDALVVLLSILLTGFALGYGTREAVSRRHHAEARRRRGHQSIH
jgi:hypothetical protein